MTAENCIFTHAQIFKLRKQKKCQVSEAEG